VGYLALGLASNLAATGCEDPRRPDGPAAKAVEPPLALVSIASEPLLDVKAPAESRLDAPYCAHGYPISADASLALVRLGALCAGSNGMQAVQSIAPGFNGERLTQSFELEAGDCVWAVAAAEPLNTALQLRWSLGAARVIECSGVGASWCPEPEPLCVTSATTLQLSIDATDADRTLADVWRRKASALEAMDGE
jgi:hypothetical protein